MRDDRVSRNSAPGIKPFASNSLFKGSSAPGDPNAEEDDRRARLAIRHILCNPHIIPIPGLISIRQVDNVVKTVKERRELDIAEAEELKQLMDQTWARLAGELSMAEELGVRVGYLELTTGDGCAGRRARVDPRR